MQRFDDRRIIITGAGSGIGQATVARLLDEGATIVACDVSQEGLAATAAAADDAGVGKRLTTAVLDVSSEEEVANTVGTAVGDLHGLDVLVNAAAIQRCANTHEHTLDDWNRTLAVNLTGTFLMTRAALPALLESGQGVVVNFTSTAASFAHPYMAAYAASKGGVLAFTHSLALEYSKQGLRAVNIQPGGVATTLALSTLDKCLRVTTLDCGPSRHHSCTVQRMRSSAIRARSRRWLPWWPLTMAGSSPGQRSASTAVRTPELNARRRDSAHAARPAFPGVKAVVDRPRR